jgi:hypothetical protein
LGQPKLGTTMEYTQIATTQRDAFMRTVEKEMSNFERQEAEFRQKDREEREARLWHRTDDFKFTD